MSSRLMQDILAQPEALAGSLDYQAGEGRAALEAAAERIRGANHVILTGMGSSLFACYPIQQLLVSRGKPAFVIEAGELLHYERSVCKGAAVVLVSRSGESIEVLNLIDAVSGEAAETVGVTNVPGSALARNASDAILLNSLPDEMVAVQTYTASLAVLLLLGACASMDDFSQWVDRLRDAQKHLAAMLPAIVKQSESWRDFLEGAGVIHLLGRGPSVASVCEGALLFNEIAKTPAVAMSAAEFRHGPAEVVDESFRGIIFAPQLRTRVLNLSLAADLLSFGGQVRVIGPASDEAPCWEVPGVPELLAPIVEAVPLQLAAYRLAQYRGIEPGKFRYCGQVTRDEQYFAAHK